MNSRKFITYIVLILSIVFVLFQIYTSTFGLMTAILQRSTHLTFVLALVFLLFPTFKETKKTYFIDMPIVLIIVASGFYLYFTFDELLFRLGDPNVWDVFFGFAIIVVLLEATRRLVGWPMTLLGIISLAYAFFGDFLPEPFGHSGRSLGRILSQMYLTTEGIFGVPLGVAATYIFLFVLFGTFMEKSGVGSLFIELAHSLAGGFRGGPAKVGIISSAAVGTVSGSPVSDAATTGAFTIPLMKKMGFKPEFAAAIEAVASSGASLVPPVMGAGAFVMADVTGIPYSTIISHAIIPALLFYVTVMFAADNEARRLDMRGLPKEELPSVRKSLMKSMRLLVPIAVLIFCLAVIRVSPIRAALYALLVMIVLTVISNVLRPQTRIPYKLLFEAVVETPKKVLVVSLACATAGIIVGTLGLTGLGLKMADLLISASYGLLPLALVYSMLIAIILGMGLPPTASYIVMAVTVAPFLIKMGLPLIVAHFFVFFYCCYAPITPPVCLAAFTTSGIAGCNPMKAGLQSVRLGISGFILPFIIVYHHSLLGIGSWTEILMTVISALFGVWGLSIVVIGWYESKVHWLWRTALFCGSILLLIPGLLTDGLGVAIVFGFVLTNTSLLFKKKMVSVSETVEKLL